MATWILIKIGSHKRLLPSLLLMMTLCLAASHYRNQCSCFAKSTIRMKRQWNQEQRTKTNIYFHQYIFGKVCKMMVIWSKSQCTHGLFCFQSTMADFQYQCPGEHVYEGIRYMAINPASALDAVKKYEYRDDDVILVTYPKAGNIWTSILLEETCFTAPSREIL